MADQEKSREFYENKLGFEKKQDVTANGVRFLLLGLPGQEAGITLRLGTPARPSAVGSRDARDYYAMAQATSLIIETDDMRQTFSQLKAREVAFEQSEPPVNPFGSFATCLDPDGQRVMLMQRTTPPASTKVQESGSE